VRVRFEVVALLEHDRIDLIARNKLDHIDLAAPLGWQRREVCLGEHDRALTVVEGLRDVGLLDDLAIQFTNALVTDAPAVFVVHLVQRHVVILSRAVDLDGHIDEPKGDRAFPD